MCPRRLALRSAGYRRVAVLELVAAVTCAAGAIGFLTVEKRLRPTLQEIATAKARLIATDAINSVVYRRIASTVRWEDLYGFRTDAAGRVVMVQPNTAEIDRLTADTTVAIQDALKRVEDQRIRIPLGQALGSQLLANVGPRIAVSVVPIGTVRSSVRSNFEQAGINQVRHRVYLDVVATVRIVVPLVSNDVQVETQVPLIEAVIMGEVPEVYVTVPTQDLPAGGAPAVTPVVPLPVPSRGSRA